MRPFVSILGIVGAAIFGLVPPGLAAQLTTSADSSAPADPSAAKPGAIVETMVVTASLEPKLASELAVAINVVDAEEIRNRQLVSVVDLLATLPGVSLARSGGPGRTASLFVRGTESNHTLVLWNGIPLNDPLFGGYDFAFLPVDGAERVEVVRGPASALYGSSSLGGVVQVLTGRQQGIRARLEGGENGYQRFGLTAGAKLGPVHLDLAGHRRRGDGELANDDFASDDLMARLTGRWSDAGSLGVLVRANESAVGLPWYSGVPSLRQRSDWQERELVLPVDMVSENWSVEGQASQYATELAYRNPDDPFFSFSDSEGEALRARGVATYRTTSWSLASGAEWERLEGFTTSDFGVAIDHLRQRNAAVFAEARLPLAEWQLQAGFRYDDNDVYGNHVSPRGGLVWSPSDTVSVRASYGEGFRAPSIGELFYPFSGNLELLPEESAATEVAVDWRPAGWRLGVATFENKLTNLIDFDPATFTSVNVGLARTRGVELQLGWQGQRVELEANATKLDVEDRLTGLALLRRAEETANLILRAHPQRATVFATLSYVGARPDLDPVGFSRIVSPSYTRIDLGGEIELRKWLAAYARVENAADESYQEIAGYPAPGRTFIGGVALDF